jgi:hypothetical protein
VALLLQKYGPLTPAAVKELLFDRAIVDSYTGAVWNRQWGHGKLSLGDLTDPLTQVASPNGGEAIAIGSTATLTWNASDAHLGVTEVDLELARSEGGVYETLAAGVPNTGSYAWTVSGPATLEARLRVTARDATGNTGSDISDGNFSITGALDSTAPDPFLDFSLILESSNPAHGPVDVEYALPRESRVSLEVFDLSGRRVATLQSGVRAAGRHQARWDGSSERGRAAGIYFIRLKAPGRELTRRIVLAE